MQTRKSFDPFFVYNQRACFFFLGSTMQESGICNFLVVQFLVLVVKVYDLTGFISPLLFTAYGKLDSKVRMEWNNRFSFFILCIEFDLLLWV